MNIGALIVLGKLLKDAGVAVSPIGPPAPDNNIPDNFCYRTDGKLTFVCWQKYIEPGGSSLDWQDYLSGN